MSTTRCAHVAWAAVPLAVLALAGPTVVDSPGPVAVATSVPETPAIPFVEIDAPDGVRFTARTFAGTVHVTADGDVVTVLPTDSPGERVVLRERLASSGQLHASAGTPSPTRVSVFVGNDPEAWRSNLPTHASVTVRGANGGVELDVAARAKNVEKVFRVPPGVEPAGVEVSVDGAESLTVAPSGELVVETGRGTLTFTAPVAYQEDGGRRIPVDVAYRTSGDAYGFAVADHDDESDFYSRLSGSC